MDTKYHSRLSEILPALALMIAGLGFLACITAWPKRWDGQLALVFAPGTKVEAIFSAAAALEGRVVRTGGLESIVVVDLDRAVSMSELRSYGAWLALDPVVLGACATSGPAGA